MKRKLVLIHLALLGAASAGSSQPIITQQLVHQPVSVGAAATFQVGVTSSLPLFYQWRRNGNDISAATDSSLAFSNVQETNAGNYLVVVTDSSGSVTSRVARLDIIPSFTSTTLYGGNYIGGTAWIDYDGDGYLDLAVANGVASSAGDINALYRNNGDGTLSQTASDPLTSDIGESLSVAWGDFDNDGLPDVFFGAAVGPTPTVANLFYHNIGNGSFEKVTGGSLGNERGNFIAAWGDYDRDGFLDIFLANTGGTNDLFRNLGDGTFGRVSNTGIPAVSSLGGNLVNGVTWADYDNDGYPDLFSFVGAGHNSLFHNNGNGTFAPVNQPPFTTDSGPSPAAAWGDYDNDGFLDLFVTGGNFDTLQHRNFLYHNNTNGSFTKVTTGNIVTDTGSFVTAAWEDFDNDGNLDLVVSRNNGSGPAQKNALYHNNGDGSFTVVTNSVLVANAGHCAGVAWGDFDNDGFPDLFVTTGQPSLLYHNGGNNNTWITFKLVGTVSNRSAIGAKVRVKATIRGNTYWQMREISNGDGLAGNSLNPHFGLGDAAEADTVRVEWPSGTVQEFHHVAPRQILTITEPARLLAAAHNTSQFSLKGGRNLKYEIQASTDLITWSQVGAVTITNLDGTAPFVDTNSLASTIRFYRAVSQ